ncbi:MAG: prepilin peptidase [Syntrophomonadaceae bacterium]|nr:prepilin peptidase [Syntrophomonadaceae bacterium]
MISYISIIIFALLIGSFLNVVIYRVPRGESVVWPGSRCTECGHSLKVYDLVPLFSYVWLKGKCRYCGGKISGRYLLVELLTAAAFLLIYLQWGISVETGAGWLLAAILISCAFIDIDKGIIPDRITLPGIIMALAISFFTIGFRPALYGALFFGGILFLVAVLYEGGMGGGDVKLGALIGAFVGLQGAVLAFILVSLLGGIWAISLLLIGKAGRKTRVKFGPFMAMGGWLAYNYEFAIITLYWQVFS